MYQSVQNRYAGALTSGPNVRVKRAIEGFAQNTAENGDLEFDGVDEYICRRRCIRISLTIMIKAMGLNKTLKAHPVTTANQRLTERSTWVIPADRRGNL